MNRPEPGPGSVIAFQLDLGGRLYSFAAVNVGASPPSSTGGQWATTSRAGAPLLTWAQLDAVLDHANHVYVAAAWTELKPYTLEQRFGQLSQQAQRAAQAFSAYHPPG